MPTTTLVRETLADVIASIIPLLSVDPITAEKVKAVGNNPHPLVEGYRLAARRAILADARMNGGVINQNRVRHMLTHPATGRIGIDPRILSATYMVLAAQRTIVPSGGFVVSDDHAGGNGNKLFKEWRLNEDPA